ncbi:phosphodiesterase [Jannaschia sp. Os4]|uniref:glycerophosphodiester phosphodiesterase family protein n=1 Tax=Jannaschia sp. Os4 TaxID=2807617 RepID=UPI00193A42E9|nr:glycerophosphodiester phosphodiesterase family protein [Jannaschia sp. Os4]MBM2575817.1 phosphodiesterase [Jannaschia sp. Os4]
MTPVPLPPSFLRGHVAHRALHGPGRPENSRAAIRAAIDLGVAVELDVQRSSDGVAMAFHDYVLDRLTPAKGAIFLNEAASLGSTPLSGGDEGIPTLAEALAEVAGRVPVLIEVKDQDGDMGPNVGPLEDGVAAALDGYAGDVALMSFNPNSVAAMAERRPDLPRGLTTSAFRAENWPELTAATRDRLRAVPDLERVGAAFVSHEVGALDMPRIAEIAARLPVLCWTVRSEAQEREARRIAAGVTFEGYVPQALSA